MATFDQRHPGEPEARRFSVTPARGVRADDGATEAAATVARYLNRLGDAVGQMLDVGALTEIRLTAPTGSMVVLFDGPETMQGVLGGPGTGPGALRAVLTDPATTR